MEMLPHIKQMNQQIRIDSVIALINEICVINPLKIDINKITKPIYTINLSWVLACCQKGYNSVADIDFKDLILNALQKDILTSLNKMPEPETLLKATNQKWLDEVYLGNELTVTTTHTYEFTPDIIVSMLLNHSPFKLLLVEKSKLYKQQKKVCDIKAFDDPALRPSHNGASKSEIFRKELESIALKLKSSVLNREILWTQLFERAKNPESLLMIKNKNTLVEKLTKNEWDRSKANRHLDSVIEWYSTLQRDF